ncbi:DUF7096 domain-containing protein [Halorubrum xinjiangense]|uniref:DUF7096 domain-containing protein n=1 Tax=Halorubrum xinjiangense TaxID=261291 RepID=UPI003C704C9A
MNGTRFLTVLVALGLILGSVPGGALGATAVDATDVGASDATTERLDASAVSAQTDENSTDDENATDDGKANDSDAGDGASRATVGQQLATVIAVTDDEVSGDVAASSLDGALEDANESERAALLAERSATLRERADEIVADQREARVAYEDGEITRGEFAQRLAVLAGQAQTVDRGFERVADGADDTSGIELRAAGYDRGANADARERLTRVTGTGASALLAQYTGEHDGEFSLEVDGGVSIEVESDDGERSREIERDQPGDGSFNVTQSEALTAATAQLSTDADGEWTLRSADRDEDGYYEFEFTFFGPETVGEAEVSVDGQTGEVFEFEEETEPREADDDDADEVPLSVSIVNGTAEPGATVTLRVTAAGEPVEGATVELNDQDAGTTDADGRITVTLPDDDEVDIEVEDGDREGELELALRSDDGDDGDDDLGDRLSVDGSVENGTVDVSVTYDGEGVEGVSVFVDDEPVGTTDADGAITFDAPADADEFEVTLVKGAFEAELEFEVGADGTLAAGDIDVDERDADDEDEDDADDVDEEDGDDADDADEEDGDDADDADDLSVAVVSGDPAPGATVTVEVTDADGEPVEGATVEVDGESAGTTDADGRTAVTLPADGDEVDIEVEDGDREGELEIEFDADDEDAEDADDADDADGADDDEDDDGEDDDDDEDDEDEEDEDDEDDDDDAEDDE